MNTATPVYLTPRQRDVLLLVALGKTDRQIATDLDLRTTTVHTHVKHLREILGARNRAHAALLAIQRGILYFHGGEIRVH